MTNQLFFCLSVMIVVSFSIFCIRTSKSLAIAWISLLGVLANLFVLKQIELFGLHATASDVFAVGSLFGLNLLREHYSLKACKEAILAAFVCMIFFSLMSVIHLSYIPSMDDITHDAYFTILAPNPRIMIASIVVFFCVQVFDVFMYSHVFRKLIRSITLRNATSMTLSQILDTILFTFLGLYGLVNNLMEVMVIALTIKLCAIALMAPFSTFSKRFLTT